MPTKDPRAAVAADRMFKAGFTAAAQELAYRWDEYSPYHQQRTLDAWAS